MKSFAIGMVMGAAFMAFLNQRSGEKDVLPLESATAILGCSCTGDITGDNLVNVSDLLSVINHWGPCPISQEICDDKRDNDCDGFIDCDDPDCAGQSGCAVEICDDGKDNDGDGLVDCNDPDCFAFCNPTEVCDDGKDNDGDGLVDCNDPDCFEFCNSAEICDDGKDNDGDGLVDCNDPDCKGFPGCG